MKRSRLKRFGKRAKRSAKQSLNFRENVLSRADYSCERCGSKHDIHAHHILPRSRGGKHHIDNGAALCFYCHMAIHDHTADDWKLWVV